MSISVKTHKLLWGASGSICAKCKRKVFEDATLTDDASVVGEEAHIVSKKTDGPRHEDPLAMDRRDLAENLLILCNACHKIVDDQFVHYTVELLRKMKADHEAWVLETLGQGDPAKKQDDMIYAALVDEWAKQMEVDDWRNWSYGMMSHGNPSMAEERVDRFEEFKVWLLGRVWPGRYPKLEAAFHNFRRVLQDMLNTFVAHAELMGNRLIIKNWNPTRWLDQEVFDRGLKRHEFYVYLVDDLVLELTRAANFICDRVREFVSPAYRVHEGAVLAMGGPFENGSDRTFKTEYCGAERTDEPYPGLDQFKTMRKERDHYFGLGEE